MAADQIEANFLIHVRPQHHYACDAGGSLLVDHVLKFERLRDDIAPLLERRGLSAGTFRNTRDPIVEEHFNREQLDLVSEIYALDLERFSYPYR